MAKDPAFLFYTSDFYMGTIELDDAQVGQYIRLMCLQHQKGHLKKAAMLAVMGGEMDPAIVEKFEIDEDGNYFNKRLEEETDKRRKYSESRRANRAKAEENKEDKPTCDEDSLTIEETGVLPSKTDMSIICQDVVAHMVNENENEDININNQATKTKKQQVKESFELFWAQYPKKVAKATAAAAWKKIKPGLYDSIVKALRAQKASEQWTKEGGKYIPNPATWLNQERWNDELTPTVKTMNTVNKVYEDDSEGWPDPNG